MCKLQASLCMWASAAYLHWRGALICEYGIICLLSRRNNTELTMNHRDSTWLDLLRKTHYLLTSTLRNQHYWNPTRNNYNFIPMWGMSLDTKLISWKEGAGILVWWQGSQHYDRNKVEYIFVRVHVRACVCVKKPSRINKKHTMCQKYIGVTCK
jgi:hypothetical protein